MATTWSLDHLPFLSMANKQYGLAPRAPHSHVRPTPHHIHFLVYQLMLHCPPRAAVYQLMWHRPPRAASNQAALPYRLQVIIKDMDSPDGRFLLQPLPCHSIFTSRAIIKLFSVTFGIHKKTGCEHSSCIAHDRLQAIKLHRPPRATSNQAALPTTGCK